jgi:ATP-dependent exoDNAse (exonuclease V) beta subunit
MPWRDMANVYRRYAIGQQVVEKLVRKGNPHQWQQVKKQEYEPNDDSVKLITMHSSKGLEFPLVCISGLGALGKEEEALQDEARLLYVAMTRATSEIIMTYEGDTPITAKLEKAMSVLETV